MMYEVTHTEPRGRHTELATSNFTPDQFLGNAGELLVTRSLQRAFPEVEVRHIGGSSPWDYELWDGEALVGRVELKTRWGFGRIPAIWSKVVTSPMAGYQLSRTRKSQYLIDSAKEVPTYLAVLFAGDLSVHITLVDPVAWAALPTRIGGRFDRGRRTDKEALIDIPWGSFQTL